MQMRTRKWLVIPSLLTAMVGADVQAQEEPPESITTSNAGSQGLEESTESAAMSELRLRSKDSKLHIEVVDIEGNMRRMIAETIKLINSDGDVSGTLALTAAGRLGFEMTPPAQPRVRIGLTTEPIPEILRAHLDPEPFAGLMITSVAQGLPADKAGLRLNDLIVGIAGQPLATQLALQEKVAQCEIGETIYLTILRRGSEQDLAVVAEPYVEVGGGSRGPWVSDIFSDNPPGYTLTAGSGLVLRGVDFADGPWTDLGALGRRTTDPDAFADGRRTTKYTLTGEVERDSNDGWNSQPATTDDPLSALRHELRAMKAQIAAMESLIDRLERPRD